MENNNVDFYGAMFETFNELEDLFHQATFPEFAKKSNPIFMSIRDRFKIHGLEHSPIFEHINELELAIHNGNRIKTAMSFDNVRVDLAKLADINPAYIKPRRNILELYANEVQNGFNRVIQPPISDKKYNNLIEKTAISKEVREQARQITSGVSSLEKTPGKQKSKTKMTSKLKKGSDISISLG